MKEDDKFYQAVGLLELLKSLAGIEQWDFSDRRSTLRIPCQLEGRIVKGDVNVRVVDISLVGLRLIVQGKVRKGSVIELTDRAGRTPQTVKAKVEWKEPHQEGFLVGVSLREDEETLSGSWLFEELKAIGLEAVKTEQRREGVRVICDVQVRLKFAKETREAGVVDLGLGGSLVECEGPLLEEGTPVRFDLGPIDDLPRVVLNCVVAVVHERELPRYGLKFETFYLGGVTDLERYLTYFYALSKETSADDI